MPHRLQLHADLGKPGADVVIPGQRRAVGLCLVGELDELVDPLEQAGIAGPDADALEVERHRDMIPAAVGLTDQVLTWDAHVVEEDLVGPTAVHPPQRSDGDAVGVHRH